MNAIKQIIREAIKEMIAEGGYVFKVDISAVPKEHLESTLKRSLKDAGMTKVTTHLVGNVSKPYLGDVDVAIDSNDLVKLFKSTGEKEDFWAKAESYMKKQKVKDYSINKGLQQIHILSPLVDKKGKHLPAVDKNGDEQGKNGYVQIDLMLGNANFMKDSLKGAEGSNYKGVWRNLLFVEILAQTISDTDSEIKHKFQVNWKTGIQYVRFRQKGKKKIKLNTKTVATSMDDIVPYIFGDKYKKFSEVDTFEKMWKAFNSSGFKWKPKRKIIIDTYKKSLTRMKLDIPKEVK